MSMNDCVSASTHHARTCELLQKESTMGQGHAKYSQKKHERQNTVGFKGPSTLATLFSHRWPRFCGGDIYSRRKPLFSSFGEHTAVCGSSVRQAVARPRHRQSVFVAYGSHSVG